EQCRKGEVMAKAVLRIAHGRVQAEDIVNALKDSGFSNTTFPCCSPTKRETATSPTSSTPKRPKEPAGERRLQLLLWALSAGCWNRKPGHTWTRAIYCRR